MIAFDTTFLIDYLDAEPAAQEFLEERPNKPFFAPSLALFEVYRGGAKSAGSDGVERIVDALDWAEPLELNDAAAQEAAVIEAELEESGEPINLGDVLIAGICRHHGARLVTRDSHFADVPDLETEGY